MTRQERDELTMRHLERAYRASHKGTEHYWNAEVSSIILEAISFLARTSDIKTTI